MEVKREELSATRVKLVIDLTAEELKGSIDKVYKSLVNQVKVPGFRPGKAPQFLVEKEVGQDKFYAEVLEEALPKAFYDAVLREKLATVDRPEIKVNKYVPTEGLSFEAEVEILPEIELPDYKTIKVKKSEIKVTEADIKKTLEEISQRYGQFKEVERKAKKGDRAEIDFEGTKAGQKIEGAASKNHPLIIGEGMFIPGFEENLVGMAKGEEKTFDVVFPADYHEKSLAGEKVTFKVNIVTVSEKLPAEIDDKFAKELAGFKSLEDFKKDITENLQKSKEVEEKRRLEEEIMTKISEKAKIELPEALVHQEIHKMIDEISHNLSHSGVSLEKYLEMTQKTHDQLEEELKPEATKRIRFALILSKIAEDEKIEATENELAEEKDKLLATIPAEEKEKYSEQIDSHEVQHQLENQIIARKTIDKLFSYCLS